MSHIAGEGGGAHIFETSVPSMSVFGEEGRGVWVWGGGKVSGVVETDWRGKTCPLRFCVITILRFCV